MTYIEQIMTHIYCKNGGGGGGGGGGGSGGGRGMESI